MNFAVNMGQTDRIIRIVVGLALIVAALTGYLGAWAWIGIVLVATAAIGNCPAYSLLGIKTCKTS
ncbi:MAG: DUF2892 domain-containing protein [Rubrimonas sp.]|uniref:YgaP family membrane protein n=1 Tax=Rubrimonas sp. TaxID=2036015 RepID=UPI002FDDE39D